MNNTSDELYEVGEMSEYVSCFIQMMVEDIGHFVAFEGDTTNTHFIRHEGSKFVVSFEFLGLEYEADDYGFVIEMLKKTIEAADISPQFRRMIDECADARTENDMWRDTTRDMSDIIFLDFFDQYRLHRSHNVRELGRAMADEYWNFATHSLDWTCAQFVSPKGKKFLVEIFPTDESRLCKNIDEVTDTLRIAGDMIRSNKAFQKIVDDSFRRILTAERHHADNVVPFALSA